jgi:16S rRNA (uracil1498-N3)-methyltransferase
MPRHDFATHRLFLDRPLATDARLELDRAQANYLVNVLRLGQGGRCLVFNGRDGEWEAALAEVGRKEAALVCLRQTRPQPPAGDLWLCFAPLKHARLDYMVQKAVEMGASRLVPAITRRTQVSRLNRERMRANVVEAAEQCSVLALPEVAEETRLDRLLEDWPAGRALVFCDEEADVARPAAALEGLTGQPLAVLVGPEGGFAPEEAAAIRRLAGAAPISLGPRILRADTAAVAALAVVQAVIGDWGGGDEMPRPAGWQ